MSTELRHLFDRELERLSNEILAFEEEENLWKTKGQISNSAGNLCLHLVGNLNTYIGAILGQSGYVRNRDAEFNLRNIARKELLEKIAEVKRIVSHTFGRLTENELQETYPQQVLGYEMTVSFFMIHLYGHLNYHLGQINYLRRMLE
ncbi:DUF1572 domain-containing protein [Pontibacter sp. HSC-14F20]|uniref:DinB family protein n=1 Tax=Pontibacter sp. HSC-14F20 TaxID=2864136 RepID=UPI001C72A241|nr:DinB family protein [Pontibacter sp. HSC-14F20]MBX0331835.1 DUF1572 domain-containing protein [Pontibacter sp. HSC-14F20]